MPYREKADLVAAINQELSTFEDPTGDVTGRVGLVEADPPISPPPAPKPKLVG
jgi:hypothetical protein